MFYTGNFIATSTLKAQWWKLKHQIIFWKRKADAVIATLRATKIACRWARRWATALWGQVHVTGTQRQRIQFQWRGSQLRPIIHVNVIFSTTEKGKELTFSHDSHSQQSRIRIHVNWIFYWHHNLDLEQTTGRTTWEEHIGHPQRVETMKSFAVTENPWGKTRITTFQIPFTPVTACFPALGHGKWTDLCNAACQHQ
jgi:hypothetical protein